jgi:hypothetical protein
MGKSEKGHTHYESKISPMEPLSPFNCTNSNPLVQMVIAENLPMMHLILGNYAIGANGDRYCILIAVGAI